MGRLEGRVAIVTGASGALGRAIATALAAEDAAVIVHYGSNRDAAEAVVDAIRGKGGRAQSAQADLSVPDQAQRLVEAATSAFGGVHVLVNNAGITRDTLVLRMKEEDWETVISTNLSGAFYCTKAVLREFVRRRGGRIINITSVHEDWPMPDNTAYCLSKGGMRMLTRTAGVELAPRK